LRKYISSDFFKGVVTLASGTAVAQFIPIIILPLLSRIYNPSDFGVLAIFMALYLFLSPYSGGRFEQAIMLPEHDKEAKNVLILTLFISFIINVLALLFILIDSLFFGIISSISSLNELNNFIFIFPLSTFLVTSSQAFLIWHNRKKRIKFISFVKIITVLIMMLLQLIFGYFNIHYGLILAVALSQVANLILFVFPYRSTDSFKFREIYKDDLKKIAIKYKEFPLINSLQSLFDNIHQQGVVFLFAKYFGTNSLGNFGMANRIVGAPLRLVGESFGHIMYQKTSELKNLKQPIHKTVLNVILVLSVLSLIILILMLITSEPLIIFLLGKDWAASGVYIRIMAVYFAFRLISAPIATIPFVISKQKLFLLISSIGNLLGLLTFWIAASFGYDDTFVLGAYALLMSAYYVVFVLQVYVQSKNLKL